jgi:hypothetical protein
MGDQTLGNTRSFSTVIADVDLDFIAKPDWTKPSHSLSDVSIVTKHIHSDNANNSNII